MDWDVDFIKRLASHKGTGITVLLEGGQRREDEFKLVLRECDVTRKLGVQELESLLGQCKQAIEDERNRLDLQRLISREKLKKHVAAQMIGTESGREVTLRTLQTWLVEPSRQSSRRCPSWAVNTLRVAIEKERVDHKPYSRWGLDAQMDAFDRTNESIHLMALGRIEFKNRRKKLVESAISDPDALKDFLMENEKHREAFQDLILRFSALTLAMKTSKTFDEFKKTFTEEEMKIRNTEMDIQEEEKEIMADNP